MRLLLPFGLTDRKAAASLECLVLEAMRATASRRRRCLACMGVRDVRSGILRGARRAAGQPERRRRRCGRRRPLQEITSLQAFVEQGHMLPFLLELHGFSLLPILKPARRYEKCL